MSGRIRSGAGVALLVVAFLIPAAGAAAQTSLQIPLQFDFINPGARSLALGGAFAGLADDATAAFANPAGLTQLGAPELSLELRAAWTKSLFLQRGRLSGRITNEGTDTIQGPVFGESLSRHVGIGYFSFVYPSRSGRWVVAGYRHELARIDARFLSEGVFQQDPAEFTSRRDSPQEAIRKLSITGYGGSGGYNITPDITVGGALVVYTFSIDSVFRRFDVDGFTGPPNLNVEFGRSSQLGSDVSVAPTIGVLFKLHGRRTVTPGAPEPPAPRRTVRLGVVYRQGASFAFDTVDGARPQRRSSFRVPNTLAVGASWEPASRTIVSVEVTRITYSRLVQDFVTDQAIATGQPASFTIDDGTEVHAGVQYAVPRKDGPPVRIRGGVWYDPDHSVHFTPVASVTTALDRTFNERLASALSQGRAQVHGTGGVGLTLTPRVEFNAGFDLASRSRLFSTSVIAHFDREVRP